MDDGDRDQQRDGRTTIKISRGRGVGTDGDIDWRESATVPSKMETGA